MDPAFSGAFRLEWKNIDKRVKEKVNMKKLISITLAIAVTVTANMGGGVLVYAAQNT